MNDNPFTDNESELENALNKGALWAITYGDIMSYLMIFFLAMFAIYFGRFLKAKGPTAVQLEKSLVTIQKVFGGKIDPSRLERIERLDQEEALAYKLKQSREISEAAPFVQIQSNEENIRLVLPESISFDSGRAELKDSAKPLLSVLARLVKDLPNDVIIEGHTDNIPIKTALYQNNFFLSAARAYNVMSYLESQGVAKNRLSGLGYGESRPVADNGIESGRAKNRRVEIVLVRTK